MKSTVCTLLFAIATTASANDVNDKLLTDNARDRATTLSKRIGDTKVDCREVTYAHFQGTDEQGTAYWTVLCGEGPFYTVRIGADSREKARATECAPTRKIESTCLTRLSQVPEP